MVVVLIAACGPGGDDGSGGPIDADTRPVDSEPCLGLSCFQVECPGGGTTSLSGTVYMPNGTLPLYGATVYVPAGTVGDLAPGAQCDRCGTVLSGGSLVQATTDTQGKFFLTNVPTTERMPPGGTVPLVIQVGKWRRQIELPSVGECVDTAVAATETRLPKNHNEGDIPLMALTTGGADSLECLLRKIGLEDSEFRTAGDTSGARVHLYAGGVNANNTDGTDQFDAALGGGVFATAPSLWGTSASEPEADILARLDDYDVVLLSCEGDQNVSTKPANVLSAMKSYADLGGRVFASHWHNIWFSDSAPDPWGAPTFNFDFGIAGNPPNPTTGVINTGFDKGQDLSDWLAYVDPAGTPGQIDLNEARHTLVSIDETIADRWIYLDGTAPAAVQYASFTTPLEVEPEDRCGRGVFSDIHVSSGDNSNDGLTFPSGGCTTPVTDMTPQEKVLAFMIFDIASCVGPVVE